VACSCQRDNEFSDNMESGKLLEDHDEQGVVVSSDYLSCFDSIILWHIDPLLGNNREINYETTAVDRQRPSHNNGTTFGSGVFCVVHLEAISRYRTSSFSAVD
jgi:hypothetical protein